MTDNEKKVSIILTTFGRADYIDRAISSALNQSYENIELIVVDDNGNGTAERTETERKMEKYFADDRVKYICHDRNYNGAYARNTGIKNSSGEYIAFLDDDDMYLPDRINRAVDYIEECGSGGVCFGVVYINPLGHISGINKHKKGVRLTKELILSDNCIIGSGSNLFIKRELIDKLNGFDTSFARFQDLEFLMRLLDVDGILFDDEITIIKENQITTYETGNELFDKYMSSLEVFCKAFKKDLVQANDSVKVKFLTDRYFAMFRLTNDKEKLLRLDSKINELSREFNVVIKVSGLERMRVKAKRAIRNSLFFKYADCCRHRIYLAKLDSDLIETINRYDILTE